MPRHFRKFVISTGLKFQGKPILWEQITTDTGVRAFNEETDGPIISELDRLADARRGGVTRISAEIYESLKKNRTSQQSPKAPTVFEKLRVADRESTLVSPKQSVSVAKPAISATAVVEAVRAALPAAVPKVTAIPPKEPPATIRKFQPRKAKKSAVDKKPAAPVEADKVAT